MPWNCQACQTTVETDGETTCPKCGTGKNSWTLVSDRTRTFAVTARAKAKYFRATGGETLKKEDVDYSSY